jgi:hypothetical protein
MSSHAHVMPGRDLMSVCCLVIALFVGALASPHRGREEEPARPAAMQDRFRTASQQAVHVCRRQQRQQPSHNTGMQSQQPGKGLELWLRRRVGATCPTYTAADRSRTSFSGFHFNITLHTDQLLAPLQQGKLLAALHPLSTARCLHMLMS